MLYWLSCLVTEVLRKCIVVSLEYSWKNGTFIPTLQVMSWTQNQDTLKIIYLRWACTSSLNIAITERGLIYNYKIISSLTLIEREKLFL
jgi:hypothetical protein